MNFGLLWVEGLLIVLLWVAAWGAWIGRMRAGWVRRWVLAIMVLVPVGMLIPSVAMSWFAKFEGNLERNWFYYFASLLAVYVLGAVVILYRGGRKEAGRPAAAVWRRGSLSLAWVFALMLGSITLGAMDLAVRTRCALLSVKVNSLYLATLPAVVSEDQNAAPIYEKAFARLKADPPDDILNPPFGCKKTFDPDEPATIAYLKRQAKTIKLLRRAAAMPTCRFDADLAEPNYEKLFPTAGLQEERNAALLLNLHARDVAACGRLAEAVADAAMIFRMSRHFGQRPTLIASLVGLGIDDLGSQTLELALPAVTRQEELVELRPEGRMPLGRMFQQAIRGEERFGLMLYRMMPEGLRYLSNGQTTIINTPLLNLRTSSGAAYFRVFYLDVGAYAALMEKMQHWAVEPYHEIRDQLPQAEDLGRKDLFMSILTPSMSRAIGVLARAEARDACGRVAVAMTRFRLDHGKLPSGLDELVPKYLESIPADPFDGKPLRLAVKEDRRIIYSVGPDGVDDGGVEIYGKDQKGDVIFTLKVDRPTTRP
jgi:hypothetical protein